MATHTPGRASRSSSEPVFDEDPSFGVLISRLLEPAAHAVDERATSIDDGQRQQRVLVLAESTVYRIENGVWSYNDFPTDEEAAAETGAHLDEVRRARMLLAWRQILAQQEDPRSGSRRLLPLQQPPRRGAAQRLADKLAFRLSLKVWSGHNFPTVGAMIDEFGCGDKTVCSALQLLNEQGLVHKVSVRTPGRRGRDRVWRPVAVASQEPDDIIHLLEAALRSGEVAGILPQKRDMARRCRVSPPVISVGYAHLEREGLITQGWPQQHARWPLWFVTATGVPQGVLPGKTRRLAIAAAMIRRMPDWLARHPDGSWSRTLLPIKHALTRDFYAESDTIEAATSLLVELQVLERAPIGHQRYLPRPPADLDAAHGITFPEVNQPGRPWAPAGEPVQWLPLPEVDDDETNADSSPQQGDLDAEDGLGENG